MHLKYLFETMQLDDQCIAVPVGDASYSYHGVIKLNDTSEYIFSLLKDDISESAIIDAVQQKYDAPREAIMKDVKNCIAYFSKKGLLVE